MRDVYQETRLRVTCYKTFAMNEWMKAAWMRGTRNEENVIMSEAMKIMEDIGIAILFHEGCILIDYEIVQVGWGMACKRLKLH